jgi:putative DNA primase/helicase
MSARVMTEKDYEAQHVRALEADRKWAADNGIEIDPREPLRKLRAAQPKTYHRTDVGNAERLVDLHGDDLRFRYERAASGVWHVWDGKVWAEDRSGEVERRAKATVATMYADAALLGDEQRAALGKWATACESVSKLKAMVESARSDERVVVRLEDLDADPWALNVGNGIIDLKTGALRPHDPAELHAKIANANLIDREWSEQAPQWATFLRRVLPDDAVRSYVQKLVGYTLAGDIGANVLPICSGEGANGKSVFLGVLGEVMGDYATTAAPGLLEQRRERGIPADLADLRGYRFAVASEVEPGRSLAVEVMKQITGEQRIKARKLYANYEGYDNVTTLWMAANDMPEVNGLDEAVFRRIRRIPFDVTIPEGERDPGLHHKLVEERDGILRWMVDGIVRYHEEGLEPPEAVAKATRDYKTESNPLAEWFEAKCERADDGFVSAQALRDSYDKWTHLSRSKVPKGKRWTAGLAELGAVAEKQKGVRGFRGIRLRQSDDWMAL